MRRRQRIGKGTLIGLFIALVVAVGAAAMLIPDYGDNRAEAGSMPPQAANKIAQKNDNAALIEWWATTERASASPGAVEALMRMNFQIDVRHILPAISVPTLVMHRKGDPVQPFEDGRYLATHIPGAKWVELEGTDHGPAQGNSAAILDEMEEFLTGMRRGTDV